MEKKPALEQSNTEREDWMTMTGMLKTYTKDDLRKPKLEEKKHIDSYNPATSSRELNPYWKGGGGGLPQTPESFRKSKPFLKPDSSNDLYSRSSSSKESYTEKDYKSKSSHYSYGSFIPKSGGWKKTDDSKKDSRDDSRNDISEKSERETRDDRRAVKDDRSKGPRDIRINESRETSSLVLMDVESTPNTSHAVEAVRQKKKDTPYLSDEKMNKLAAKIVKAEIMGNTKLVDELKVKLEAAREYRKQNPDAGKEDEDDGVMLMSTNSMGNSRPLAKGSSGDPKSKGGKRKAETHASGERTKYFGNDDKYNLSQMVSFLNIYCK